MKFWVIFFSSYTEHGPFDSRQAADDWAFESTGSPDYRIYEGSKDWAFTE
jgi:hypothetical protein